MVVNFRFFKHLKGQTGAVIILVALVLFILIGVAALAIDLGHQYVVRNQLQNAADAGALAGAEELYYRDDNLPSPSDTALIGTVNPGANAVATDTATQNKSQNVVVEVASTDVQRGHWSFSTTCPPGSPRPGCFTPNDSLDPVDLTGYTTEELDVNTDFVNAVRVVTHREATPAASFFARIFGYTGFARSTEAIAYIGYAGPLAPGDVDQPIAICEDSIKQDDKLTCNIGRFINSGSSVTTHETGGWTSFNQTDPCTGGTNASEMKTLVCGSGNPLSVMYNRLMATTGGQDNSVFMKLYDCWKATTGQANLWEMTLPVITCPGNNVGTCENFVGAVKIKVVWINNLNDPSYSKAPTQMEDWSSNDPDGQVRWNSFVQHFNLVNTDGSPAPYAEKSIYFLPDCEEKQPPIGATGGENFGILARYPALVH
jgi:Flp pilus assembly protein TadG